MGRLMFEAVMQRDQPVVMATCTISAVGVLLGTIAVDVLCGAVDPRARQT
jgi:peptide/nickel transport system permease protein